MTNIKENLQRVRESLKDGVLLVAVTKTHTPFEINQAVRNGVTDIGENKVQEIMDKYDQVDQVRWHMIGHLQTNKVKYIIDKVDLIHSVDSMKLAKEIDKRAAAISKTMDVLIQINPAMEESKFGVETGQAKDLIMEILESCPNIRVRGLMSVAPFAEDGDDIRHFFKEVKDKYDEIGQISHPRLDFSYLSMGMSHDYQVAMEEGSNLVRIGSAIFGQRVY